jgi:hypothetical protein
MWLFNNYEVKSHADLLPECSSIVYIINYVDGRHYYGKKIVRSIRKRPPLAGKKRSRRVLVDIPFVNYKGSHELAESLEIKSKVILYQCSTKTAATYLETALLIYNASLFNDECLNSNIGGKFFDNALDGLLESNSEETYT